MRCVRRSFESTRNNRSHPVGHARDFAACGEQSEIIAEALKPILANNQREYEISANLPDAFP
jgi:hypothetical protein